MDAPRAIGGRFIVSGATTESVVGSVLPANDMQGGARVRVVIASEATLPSSALADRALREWKQLAKVGTPKIVRVLDQGKLDDGKIFVATDMPAGLTLDELIEKEGALPIERIQSIISQVGEALTEAQKVGVIHRDVAPRNIHIDGENVTVGEFGLAQAVNDKVFGAPAFLSPEQAEGKPVDQRSNIYSLGAVIYYMLTGKPPFSGTAESLLAQHVAGTPAPPSALRSSVPAELDRIVMKALEKSGGRRHLTLRQLITEVESVSPTSSVVKTQELATAETMLPQPASVTSQHKDAATVLGMAAPTMADILAAREAEGGKDEGPKTISVPALSGDPADAPPHEVPVFDSSPSSTLKPGVNPRAHDDVPVFESTPGAAPKVKAQDPAPAAAATMMAEAPAIVKAAEPAKPVEPVQAKPAEVAKAAEAAKPAAAKPSGQNPPVKKPAGGFRETAWFKKGEIEEEMAKAQAGASSDPLAPTGITGQHSEIDPNALNVSSQDQSRLSLKTGATQMMPAIKLTGSGNAQALPGERMDEAEMLREIDGGRKWLNILAVVAGVVIIGTILYFAVHKTEPTPAPTSQAPAPVAPVAVAPAPSPPPPPPPMKLALDDAKAALAKADYPATVDALLRATHDGSDQAQVTALAVSTSATLVAASLDAKHRRDGATFAQDRALAAKLHPLLPAAPAAKHPTRIATRRH